jgi:hypothetical protein
MIWRSFENEIHVTVMSWPRQSSESIDIESSETYLFRQGNWKLCDGLNSDVIDGSFSPVKK